MNIFTFSKSPSQSPKEMIDKHIVKMPTETCQMLHTNALFFHYVSIYGVEPTLAELKKFHTHINSKLMKPTMLNHPSTIWARQSLANFTWLYEYGLSLCIEYTHRYDKTHGSYNRILDCGLAEDIILHHNYPVKELTPVTIAMDDKYRLPQEEKHTWSFVIRSYRHYYLEGKWQFAEWKTQKPVWWPKNHIVRKHNERIVRYNALGKTQLKLMEEEK